MVRSARTLLELHEHTFVVWSRTLLATHPTRLYDPSCRTRSKAAFKFVRNSPTVAGTAGMVCLKSSRVRTHKAQPLP